MVRAVPKKMLFVWIVTPRKVFVLVQMLVPSKLGAFVTHGALVIASAGHLVGQPDAAMSALVAWAAFGTTIPLLSICGHPTS